jgi:hypothetical protein
MTSEQEKVVLNEALQNPTLRSVFWSNTETVELDANMSRHYTKSLVESAMYL